MDRLVIFGAENVYAAELYESVRRLELEVIAAVLTGTPEWSMSGIPCILQEEEVSPELAGIPAVTPDIIPGARKDRVERARGAGFERFRSIMDPTAVMASSAVIGLGTYVNALAVIGATVRLHDHAYVNRAASVGHHTRIEEYGTVGPGVTIASHCVIGRGAFVGAGATITPSRIVGDNSVVGGGAVVIEDVPANTLVVGVPARVVKEGITGFGETSV
ncbi:MAG: acetyltransferase [Hyphomicrobiales bacterium]